MPRSARDSDEEVDVKPGRKTRALAETQSLDSPLRRSSRNKLCVKHNESSPESPLSDTSNTSNTQIRATRRRTTTMDNSALTEKSRTLRSRMNSVSSDVNEITETDVGTPTKKTRSNVSNEVPSKTNSRRSKRFTRAGSEANSPPMATRVRRNTRASSMEPEANTGNKLIEKHHSELVSTPIKIKRRASVLPSEVTLLEEREEFTKIPMVTLDRTLPNLHEIKQLGSGNSPKAAQKRESLSTSEDKLNPSHHNIDEKATEDDTSVKGPLENPPANFTSNNFEDAEKETVDDKPTSDNGKNEMDNSKTLSVETIKQIESSVDDKPQVVSQNESLNTSNEMELKLEDLDDEKHEDHSNKENLITNVITDSQNTETAISNTLLQSPKPLSESNINANKSLEEKAKSPCIETIMTPMRRHSKQLSEVSNDSVSMEDHSNTDAVNNLPSEGMDTQLTEEEISDNMPKLAITEIESVGGSQYSEHSDKCSLINVVSTSSLDDSIEFVECVEDTDVEKNDNFTEIDIESNEKADKINTESNEIPDKIDIESIEEPDKIDTESNEKAGKIDIESNEEVDKIDTESNEKADKIDTETNEKVDKIGTESNEKEDKIDTESNEKVDKIDTESNEKLYKIDNKECNKDVDMETDVPNIKESINKNEESEKDTTNENVITDNKCYTRDKDDKSDTSKKENDDDETNDTTTPLSSNLNNVELSESIGVKLISDTQHSINLEHENVHCSQSINKTSNLSSNTNTILESSDAHMSPKDSTVTNINEDNDVGIVIKSSQSSTVTEIPAENVEEAPERGEQSEKVSVLDDSSTLKKQPTDKSELNETTSDTKQAKSKEYQESIEVDDSDSNTNVENLFQDIPATEWKNADTDKNSVHSMSTERMENESEGECDLVLVDKEAWLVTENIKTEKEKEAFDYDSDDTILLKARNDAKKAQNDKTVLMDVSEDEYKLNINKDKSSNTNKRRSTKENVIKDTEDTAQDVGESSNLDEGNKSMVKDSDKLSTSKCNVSLRKSLGDNSLSESQKTIEIEGKSPSNKLSEDVPKRRKSLKKSMQETNDKLEKSIEIVKQGKSSNKSICKEDEIKENVITSAKKSEKSQSLNNSLKKKVKLQKLHVNLAEDSDNEVKESKAQEKRSSVTKKKSQKNYVSVVNIESDSDDSNVSDSDNSENKSVRLPKFLFKTGSDSDTGDDNESSKSMDSDIQREYNLHGRDISKFSDDDVPGDICRASETESSDPDDDGSDLADFVVDDDEVEDDGSESEEVEEDEEIENEELDSEKDAKEKDQDNDIQVVEDKEMEVEEDIVPEAIQKEQQDEDDKENVDEEVKNKSLNISKKEKKKTRKLDDLSSSQIGSGKKKKKLITNTSGTASPSLSEHIETKKSKQKRTSGEFLVENVELSLNESQVLFSKKMLKLSKSMECSTPKLNSVKQEKSNIKACDVEEEPDSPDETEVNNTSLKKKLNLKKLNKTKGNETLMHRSLPSELIDLVSKTNLSRPMSSKVSELNRTTIVPGSETPTTKYLKKQKLNESAPTLKLGTKMKKLTNNSNNEEQNNQVDEDENGNSEPNVEATQGTNDSLKRKLLKVADDILEKDRQKKRKKRKQPAVVETTDPLLPAEDVQEDNDSETVRKNKRSVSVSNIEKNNETQNLTKKKKKKKKTGDSNVPIIEEIYGESTKAKLEKQNKKIHNEAKMKKKEKLIEGGSHVANANVETKKMKKKKKLSHGLASEIVLDKQLPKKKSKKQKLSEEVVSQDQETALGKPTKKKKQLISEDDALEYEEVPIKKVPKKKRKLSKDTSDQNENISEEKVAKKKQKLLSEGVKKEKVKRTVTVKPELREAISDSDEGPETVAFSKARDEAFEVLKRTADSIKANKEMKKKKQKEHSKKMQKEKEIKIKKLETKSIKRLPEDVLENLSDVPIKPLKKKKISKTEEQVTLPSKPEKVKNMFVEDDFTLPSCAGSTTEFSIVDLQKIKKKKKISEVASFRQKMLARNCRQPISAYLMYLEKQKAKSIA